MALKKPSKKEKLTNKVLLLVGLGLILVSTCIESYEAFSKFGCSKLVLIFIIRDIPIYVTMLCLLVVINCFQNSAILWEFTTKQSKNVIFDFGFPFKNTMKIISLPMSEIYIVNQGWANYIISFVMTSGILTWVLGKDNFYTFRVLFATLQMITAELHL